MVTTNTTNATEYTPEQIIQYIGPAPVDGMIEDDIVLSNITVAVAVIGATDPGTSGWDREMVRQAFDNILQWAEDYGCHVVIEDGQPAIDVIS